MRLGFRGAANALKGGSTPPPAAKSPNWEILNKNGQEMEDEERKERKQFESNPQRIPVYGLGPGQDCG